MTNRYFGLITKVEPMDSGVGHLQDLFSEAKRATTWEICLHSFGLSLNDGLNSLGMLRGMLSKRKVVLTHRPGYKNGQWPRPYDRWKFWQELPPWLTKLIKDRKTEVFVDWELDLIRWTTDNGVKPIIPWSKVGASHHDFEGGRNAGYLGRYLKYLRATKARAFLKLIVTAKSTEDCEVLKAVPRFYMGDSRPLIFLAMGEKGKESMRKGLAWGSAGIYGYLPERESADPARLSVDELRGDPSIKKILSRV